MSHGFKFKQNRLKTLEIVDFLTVYASLPLIQPHGGFFSVLFGGGGLRVAALKGMINVVFEGVEI